MLRRAALPARQRPGDLAYCLLMPLIPDLGKVAGDLKLHTLVERDLPRTFFSDTFPRETTEQDPHFSDGFRTGALQNC